MRIPQSPNGHSPVFLSVGIDITKTALSPTRVPYRASHRPCCTIRRWLRDVTRIRRHAEPDDLRQGPCPACDGRFKRFENQHRATLTQYQARSIGRTWAAGILADHTHRLPRLQATDNIGASLPPAIAIGAAPDRTIQKPARSHAQKTNMPSRPCTPAPECHISSRYGWRPHCSCSEGLSTDDSRPIVMKELVVPQPLPRPGLPCRNRSQWQPSHSNSGVHSMPDCFTASSAAVKANCAKRVEKCQVFRRKLFLRVVSHAPQLRS